MFLDPSLYQDLHQTLMRSILGQDSLSIQVWWKSVEWFLSNPADKPTNRGGLELLVSSEVQQTVSQSWRTRVTSLHSSRKFEDLRPTGLTLMKNSTWLWLGINNVRVSDMASSVRTDIILNVGAHLRAHSPTRLRTATHSVWRTCFSFTSATELLLPPPCRMCFIEEKHTTLISGQSRHVLWFSASFYRGGGEQYLRVIFSAVRMCSVLQSQGWY